MKILYVVPYAPNRVRTRPFHLIKALAADGHKVTLATLWGDHKERAELEELRQDLSGLLAERIAVSQTLWNCIRALPSSQPIQSHYSWSPKLARRITSAVAAKGFDVVHVEHLRGARYGLSLQHTATPHPPLIWDSVDCISHLFRHAAQESTSLGSRWTTRLELNRTEYFEGWLATQFRHIVVTSESDRQGILNLAARWRTSNGRSFTSPANVTVVSNGVDLKYFAPTSEPREPLTLVITGKMSYHANITSVIHFAERVMPKIWSTLPETKLWIVGKNPPTRIQRLGIPWQAGLENQRISTDGQGDSRIQITGTVQDIRPFLRRATLAIAPIRYGVGIQNKVLEALACKTPVVASARAVAALDVESGRELEIAEDDEGMAHRITSLLKHPDRRQQIGQAGRAFVERQHDWQHIVQGLTAVYRQACRQNSSSH